MGRCGQDFLQFAGGHEAAREGESAENDLHGEDGHHEGFDVGSAQVELRRTDESNAEGAEGVAERGPLRDGGHGDATERDADDGAEHEGDEYPLVIGVTAAQKSADDGEQHADFAGPDAMAGGGRRTQPFERKNEECAGDQVCNFDDEGTCGKIVHMN